MDLILKVLRQKDRKAKGKIETYPISNISEFNNDCWECECFKNFYNY